MRIHLEEHFGSIQKKINIQFWCYCIYKVSGYSFLLCKSLKSLFGNNYYSDDGGDTKHIVSQIDPSSEKYQGSF